jgi:ATP:ADP antiporter, AAA family
LKEGQTGFLMRLLQRAVDVREGEVRALLLSCAYFFFLFSSYYILRPIREEMGVNSGIEKLPWLFTGTLLATLALNPLFSTLVVKFPAKRFISISYRFFMLNMLVFYGLLKLAPQNYSFWIGSSFYIWTSVFNLFVVAVFWSFMADTLKPEQGKRLFGFIGVGGTLGSIVGSAITAGLAEKRSAAA